LFQNTELDALVIGNEGYKKWQKFWEKIFL
jgi:hypothetical protein